jgi:hypothetical protein
MQAKKDHVLKGGDSAVRNNRIFVSILLCALLVFSSCGKPPGEPTEATGSTRGTPTSSEGITASVETKAPVPSAPDENESQASAPDESAGGTQSSQTAASSKPAGTTGKAPSGSPASSKPSVPPATSKAPTTTTPSNSTTSVNPVYTEADYAAIVAEIRQYAQSRTKVTFLWDNANRLTMDNAGYYGTPNLARDKRNGVINTLKYHIDKIENLIFNQSGQGSTVEYRIIWFEIEQPYKSVAFVALYG